MGGLGMSVYFKHFKTITKHKLIVMLLCMKCGYWKRGILHDLSKYGPVEFFSSARHFSGKRSPIDNEKREKGYSLAWQHHKGHNPHHWEYWIDNVGSRANDPIKIPREYVVEMICDWVGAGIVYSGQKPDFNKLYKEPLEYYNEHKYERIFHPATQRLIEYYLNIISAFGVNEFCRMARKDKCKDY